MAEETDLPELRPFDELRTSGLLWFLNATVFHPRGYALALHYDGDENVIGWSLVGDGTEPWGYDPSMKEYIDEMFLKIKELMP